MSRDRDERREIVGDAYYELWRAGRNPDHLDIDRAYDMAYDHSGEEIAREQIRREDAARSEREYAEQDEAEEMYRRQEEAEFYAKGDSGEAKP